MKTELLAPFVGKDEPAPDEDGSLVHALVLRCGRACGKSTTLARHGDWFRQDGKQMTQEQIAEMLAELRWAYGDA